MTVTTADVCLNGHPKAEHMNDKGVCRKCADHYRAEMRIFRTQSPAKVTQNAGIRK